MIYTVKLHYAPKTTTVQAAGPVEAAEAAYLNYNDGSDELLFVEVVGPVVP